MPASPDDELSPEELEERLCGWPERMGADAQDYLYPELRTRVQEQLATIERQDAKALALFGVQSFVLGAGGIFGDLELSGDLPGSLPSWTAFAAYVVATIFVAAVYWPWGRWPGIDPLIFTDKEWRGHNADEMRAASMRTLARAYHRNANSIRRRGWRLLASTVSAGLAVAMTIAIQLF